MEQPWNQHREGGGYAMGEIESSCHAAAHLDLAMTTTDRCEAVDGALLMELIMEDLPSSDLLLDGDVDRQLSRVIRSLEAEIDIGAGGGGQQAVAMMADEGAHEESLGRIEDVLSDDMDDGYDYEGASSSSFLDGHDEEEGWCVYTNGYESGGVLGYDTMVDHQYYYCPAEGSAEHVYLPLWE